MATTSSIRALASTYALSSSTYLTMSNASNMYTNTDSTTYATVKHNRAATTAYYVYVRGFNFSAVPSNATVTSAILKVKAKVSGSSAYTPVLYNGTTSLSKNLSGTISTSAVTRTVDITSNWATYKGYGSSFGVRLGVNRSSKNTVSYLYIYGAEIAVTYTTPVSTVNVTVTCHYNDTYNSSYFGLYTANEELFSKVGTLSGSHNSLTKGIGNFSTTYSTSFTVDDDTDKLDICTKSLPVGLEVTGFKINNVQRNWDTSGAGLNIWSYQSASNITEPLDVQITIQPILHLIVRYDTTLFSSVYLMDETEYETVLPIILSGEDNTIIGYEYSDFNLHIGPINDSYDISVSGKTVTQDNSIYKIPIKDCGTEYINIVATPVSGSGIYIKRDGSWIQATAIYKKINGVWTEIDKTQIDTTKRFKLY